MRFCGEGPISFCRRAKRPADLLAQSFRKYFGKDFCRHRLWTHSKRALPARGGKSGKFRSTRRGRGSAGRGGGRPAAGGNCWVNVAERPGIRSEQILGVEIYNPCRRRRRAETLAAIAAADEIATALPSVDYFQRGSPSPATLLARGLVGKLKNRDLRPTRRLRRGESQSRRREIARCRSGAARRGQDFTVRRSRAIREHRDRQDEWRGNRSAADSSRRSCSVRRGRPTCRARGGIQSNFN